MICCLIRHGKDDDSVRGGWSNSPLTAEGTEQVARLAKEIRLAGKVDVGIIYTSDLLRAKQTAELLSDALGAVVMEMPQFRETNNGVLAGMDNQKAAEQYPGLYWAALDWEEAYPGGESPCKFYNRIAEGWRDFKNMVRGMEHDVMLVTHGGVINVIQCVEHAVAYSNKVNPFPIGNAEMIEIEI